MPSPGPRKDSNRTTAAMTHVDDLTAEQVELVRQLKENVKDFRVRSAIALDQCSRFGTRAAPCSVSRVRSWSDVLHDPLE